MKSYHHPCSPIPVPSRRGSALLIVLGMLAFMVVSAVGFSMYMRQSRAPSSYLRRNVASRYLVKAALANAIEDLEGNYNDDEYWGVRDGDSYRLNQNRFYGIYDDPYPGCGLDNQYAGTDARKNGDYWLKRVFCPFGPVGEPTSLRDALDPEKQTPTVPTLTLEALAYLPPAIVDDVRKVSRLTRTACWRPLPYDAGRFAYTAVNVSDLFDINRLQAEPRNAGDCRISLASLATTDATTPTTVNAGDAGQLANLDWTQAAMSDVPYVSLADFALANAGTDYSPFSKFIGGASGAFLNNNSREANGLFITDTWFPPTNAVIGGVTYNLGGGHQPFKNGTFGSTGAASHFLATKLQKNPQDNAGEIFEKNLGIGLVCLYDYLDRDSQPISLCLPTTEAVPMVIGISAPVGLQPTFGQVGSDQGQFGPIQGTIPGTTVGAPPLSATAMVKRDAKKMGITSFGNQAIVKILTTYPFKRMATSQRTKNWTVRGLMRVYLAKSGMDSRLANGTKILPTTQNGWQDGVADGVATFISDSKPLSAFASDVKTWSDAVDDSVALTFSNLSVQMPIYWEVTEQVDTSTVTPPGLFTPNTPSDVRAGPFQSLGNLGAETATLRPLDAAGNFFAGWSGNGPWDMTQIGAAGAVDMSTASIVTGSEKFRLQVSLWIQVMEGSKVVDMVPACIDDDDEWLNANLPNANFSSLGTGVPLLNFCSKDDVDYKQIKTDLDGKQVTFQDCASLWAVDPRYNFAPENWYATDDLQVDKQKWYDALKQNYLGRNGRDRDIFMFVSDQEWLQDIGELQFLPYLQDMNGNGIFPDGDYSPAFNGKPFSDRMSPTANFACKGYFWKTYTAYDNGNGTDPIYELPYQGKTHRFHSNVGGFKLNPYSEDDRVLFAALVGTPYDYYLASTNEDSNVKQVQNINLSQMMSTYSFGQSSVAQITDAELADLGDAIRNQFQDKARRGDTDWADAWDGLQWQLNNASECGDDNKKLFGVTLSDALHNVDRKYLYSFWRECFDNRQQLFLIFVRAEPTAIGGGASGSLSSAQLGGRAVALVWRDPDMPSYKANERTSNYRRDQLRGSGAKDKFRDMKKNTPTHQTRVLFFHQFD